MVRRLNIWSDLKKLSLILAAAQLFAVLDLRAQDLGFPPLPSGSGPEKKILDQYPEKPSLPAAFTIPVGPLRYSAPGPFYLLRRQSLASLDFLDENRLLFTFRVSGMIQRGADDNSASEKQRIRAVVVALRDGKIESEAEWTVPDRARYLWMLKDGHFMLRVPEGLDRGDAALKMTPFLRFPGQLLWLELDPTQQFMITNSLEPAPAGQDVGEPNPSTPTQASAVADGQKPGAQSVLVARTLQRESGEVTRVARFPWTHQTEDSPMNSQGYLQKSPDGGPRWLLKLNYFDGRTRDMARVDSTCPPKYSFVSDTALFLTTCDPESGGWKLAVLTGNREKFWHVWEQKTSWNAIWPMLVMAPNGSLIARETLILKRPVNRYKNLLGAKDIEGQMVRVLDAATGKVVLEAPLTPMLDGGGNVAISPSGQRVAILNAGAIQVFQLPAPAPSPVAEK